VERKSGEATKVIKFMASLGLLLLATACHTAGSRNVTPTIARFFLEAADGRGVLMTLPRSGVQVAVGAKPVFTEFDIVDVDVVDVELGKCLEFKFTTAAGRDLYRLTGVSQGRRLVLSLDGKPIGARRIDRPFNDATVLIFVETSDEALPGMAENLRQTALALQQAAAK